MREASVVWRGGVEAKDPISRPEDQPLVVPAGATAVCHRAQKPSDIGFQFLLESGKDVILSAICLDEADTGSLIDCLLPMCIASRSDEVLVKIGHG
jgi:hypothetical protein